MSEHPTGETTSVTPPGPAADLVAALAAVAAAPRLLVASDFDGVLAPFVLDPLDARAQAGTIADLQALAGLPHTHAAVVSGRDLATLDTLTGLTDADPVVRVGSHGAQSSRATGLALDADQQATLGALVAEVAALVAAHDPRIRLEQKPAAVVLHTRGLDADAVATADAVAAQAAARPGVRLLLGKGVAELSVVHADKGTALRALADDLGADATVYLGDDVTDEHAFAVLGPGDLGIKVGPGETAARHRVDGCDEVPEVIATLRRLRRAHLGEAPA